MLVGLHAPVTTNVDNSDVCPRQSPPSPQRTCLLDDDGLFDFGLFDFGGGGCSPPALPPCAHDLSANCKCHQPIAMELPLPLTESVLAEALIELSQGAARAVESCLDCYRGNRMSSADLLSCVRSFAIGSASLAAVFKAHDGEEHAMLGEQAGADDLAELMALWDIDLAPETLPQPQAVPARTNTHATRLRAPPALPPRAHLYHLATIPEGASVTTSTINYSTVSFRKCEFVRACGDGSRGLIRLNVGLSSAEEAAPLPPCEFRSSISVSGGTYVTSMVTYMVTKIKAKIVAVGEILVRDLGDLLLDARRGLAYVADEFVVEPTTVPLSVRHSAEAKFRLFNLIAAVAAFSRARQRLHHYYNKTPAEDVGAEQSRLSELAHELAVRCDLELDLSPDGALKKSPMNMLIPFCMLFMFF